VGFQAVVKVAYGCVTNSLDRVQRYVLPRVGDRSLTLLWNQTSMTQAYNAILDAHLGNPPDALILIHDDLELVDPDTEAKFLDALKLPNVALVGVAGGFGHVEAHGLAWWNGHTIGHQLTDSGMLNFGPREGPREGFVTAIEGSVMTVGPRFIREIRFDETFTGFHGYDDIGMVVNVVHNMNVWVADVDTHHHTTLGFKSIESEQAWLEADRKFRAKWAVQTKDEVEGNVSDSTT
jgi:glycosyl transferase family 2